MQASDSHGCESEPPCSEEGRGLRGDEPCPCPSNARQPRVMGLADQKGEAGFGSEFPAIDIDGASLETGATGSMMVCREGLGHKASSGQEDDTAQEPVQCDGLWAATLAAKATAAAVASSSSEAAAAVTAVAGTTSKREDTVGVLRAAAPSDPSPPSAALAATTEPPPAPQPATPPPPEAGLVPQQQAPAGRQPSKLPSTSLSTPASAEPGLPPPCPPYLAAGVLPFCVLGGDLLFLLGQQLRFRSRVRHPSLSEMRGVSNPVGDCCSAGGEGGLPRVIVNDSPAASSCNSSSRDGASADGGEPRRGSSNAAKVLTEARSAPSGAVGCPAAGQPFLTGKVEQGQGQGTVPAGLLWSDFGGAREAGDADAKETASREFAEESFGMFHDVRLESDSVSRSQAAMEATLRDPSLKGKRVFECRNGGYVMFIAEVDFVPDLMMKLARKDIVEGGGGGGGDGDGDDNADNDVGGASTAFGLGGQGRASPPGFSEKTDFAWVPASTLLGAMRDSRHRSTRKVVLKLGGCRYLRLFHKFVISLWGLDLAAVIKAVSTPLHRRKRPLPAPRALLLKPGASHRSTRRPNGKGSSKGSGGGGGGGGGGSGSGRGDNSTGHGDSRAESSSRADSVTNQVGGGRSAIRGIDCIRPSFLSGRKRSSLGIIDERCYRQGPSAQREDGGVGEDGSDGAAGSAADSEPEGAAGVGAGADVGSDGLETRGREWAVGGGAGRKSRGKKSGAACRKRRRQCKEARRLKAETAAAAAAAAVVVAAAAASASVAVAAEATAVALATRQVAAVGAL